MPPINRTLPTIKVFVFAIIHPAYDGIFAYRGEIFEKESM